MITVAVDFDRTFHGTDLAGRREWPPAPARLFAALVSGCHNAMLGEQTCAVLDCLRSIEGSPAPVIVTGPIALPDRETTEAYVAAKPLAAKGSATAKELRKMHGRTKVHSPEPVLATSVRYCIDADIDAELLDAAARGVSYVGTSTDTCTVQVSAGVADVSAGDVRWAPVPDPVGRNRSWFPGLLDLLDARFEVQRRESVTVPVRQDQRVSYVVDVQVPGQETGMVPLAFGRPVRDSRQISTVMERVTAVVGGDVLPLVHADVRHGDGTLLGVAVWGVEAASKALAASALGLESDPADRRMWMGLDRYFAAASVWRTALPVYAPADRAVASDYLAYLADRAGCELVSFERTGPRTKGCARSVMEAHPRAFVPYVVRVHTTEPSTHPVLSPESLMVPVVRGDGA